MRSLGANPRPQGVKPLKATGHGCEYGWVTIGATFALLALYLLIQST
jgi:hypothetical protein